MLQKFNTLTVVVAEVGNESDGHFGQRKFQIIGFSHVLSDEF
jgi:hypothetical protein